MKNTNMLAATLALAAFTVSACTGGGDSSSSSSSSSGGSTSSSGSTSSTSSSGSTSSTSSGGSTSSSSGSTGGSFTCDTKSKCPNQKPQDKAACEELLTGKCGDEYKATGDCTIANEVCAADGTSDTKATNSGPCKAQADAFLKCFGGG